MKPSLNHLINKRDRAFSEEKHLKYLRLREAVISNTCKLKNDFLVSAIKTNQSSTMWRFLNQILSRKGNRPVPADLDKMNDIFSSVFEDSPTCDLISSTHSSLLSISLKDVIITLRSLRKGSPGPDSLPFWVFRDYWDFLAPAIHHICGLSFTTGVVPNVLKRAIVVPIPKCDKPTLLDFRPISLLPILFKVMEKIVLKKWLKSIIPKLSYCQFAFIPRTGQGTVTALTFLTNRILSYLDAPGAVKLLMVDFLKAFDKIPIATVLNSLSSLEVPEELITWVSYLHARKQRVKIQNEFSDRYSSTSGVPQGGVLSPIIFAIATQS